MNSSATSACTYIRLAATQDSPRLRVLAWKAPSTATSRSASANTSSGALPPSSMDVRSRCSPACSTSFCPTGVDPVKETLRSRASASSGATTEEAEDEVMTLSTPSGSPASCSRRASASSDSGVACAGLTTIVQPAATAGPIFRVPMAAGKFHGVMSRHGPTGCLRTSVRPPPAALRT